MASPENKENIIMQFNEENSRLNSGSEKKCLRFVGQDMQILNPLFFRAIEERDSRAVAAMARRQAEAGADALDLNLGPAKKNSSLLTWVIETVQAAVDLPLFVASQILSMPDLLQQHQDSITVNSVTADPTTLVAAMERAGAYGAGLVVLLTKPGQSVFSADDRLLLAAEVLETAACTGFPLARLHLDPLFRPGPQGLPDLEPVLATLATLPLLSQEKVHTIAALSSASAFLPAAKRPALHQRLLPLLAEAGLDTLILNCNDRRLMEIGRHLSDRPAQPLWQAATA
jgi:cobalamin-dependent methionine synthase I